MQYGFWLGLYVRVKYSFYSWSLSFYLAAFSFAIEVLLFPLLSYTDCLAKRGCVSSTNFLILWILPWIYSSRYFLYVFVLFGLKFLHIGILGWVRMFSSRCLIFYSNYSEVTLLRERKIAALFPSFYCFLVISEQYVVEFSCLPYFWEYFIKTCSFPIFNFSSY